MSEGFEAWQAEATPDEAVVRVCLNRRLYRDFQEAADELEAAHQASEGLADGPSRELVERVTALEEQVRQSERAMVFRCLPFEQWRALGEQHPATDEQREKNKYAELNAETFWPAAVAASCVEPGVTVEQAVWLRDFLPRGKWDEILTAVRQVNVGGSDIPKSVSSIVAQLRSGLSSTTADPEEYPSPSSGGE